MLAKLLQHAVKLRPDETGSRRSELARGNAKEPIRLGVEDDGGDAFCGRECHNYYITLVENAGKRPFSCPLVTP